MNITKLRSVAKYAQKNLACFKWTVLSAKEVGVLGIVDPPCAVLRGRSEGLKLTVTMDVDGEISISDDQGRLDFLPSITSGAASPKEIALGLADRLRQPDPEIVGLKTVTVKPARN